MPLTDFENFIQLRYVYYNMNRCILCTQAWFSCAGYHLVSAILIIMPILDDVMKDLRSSRW